MPKFRLPNLQHTLEYNFTSFQFLCFFLFLIIFAGAFASFVELYVVLRNCIHYYYHCNKTSKISETHLKLCSFKKFSNNSLNFVFILLRDCWIYFSSITCKFIECCNKLITLFVDFDSFVMLWRVLFRLIKKDFVNKFFLPCPQSVFFLKTSLLWNYYC